MTKTAIIITVVVIACLAITFGVMAGVYRDKWFGGEDDSKIDPGASDYVDPDPQPAPASGVACPGWETITIAANTTTVRVDFPNPIANKDKYYLTFKLLLKEGNEELYESRFVPPGQHITTITLNRALPAGTYDAIVHIQPYRMSDDSQTNNLNVDIKLVVK